jgi:hypothetical protein
MNHQEPDIDKLLEQWKAPETPPWFKTKVMQAVREETADRGKNQNLILEFLREKLSLRYMTVAAGVAVVATMVALTVMKDEPRHPAETVSLEDALDSFAAYTQQENTWGGDLF